MIQQIEFIFKEKKYGFHLITDEVLHHLPKLPQVGLLHLFIKHTSAGLIINENADPDVQTDLNTIFDRLIHEKEPYYIHTCEGADDTPAHAKSTIVGASFNHSHNQRTIKPWHMARDLPVRVPEPRYRKKNYSMHNRIKLYSSFLKKCMSIGICFIFAHV